MYLTIILILLQIPNLGPRQPLKLDLDHHPDYCLKRPLQLTISD